MPNSQLGITKSLIGVLSEGAKFESLQLPAGSLLRLDGSYRGVSFLCRSGLCWITQEGDSKDYLLQHEQNFTINQDGVVVVQALADTELLVSPD
jgi:hypothetical protein